MKTPLSVPADVRIDRVIQDAEGYATSPARSRIPHDKYEIAFVRNDGWTLAAPKELVLVAFETWPLEWKYFWRDGESRPIDQFSPQFEGSVIKDTSP